MIRRERLAIMMRGKQHVVTIQIGQRNVGREALFGMHQDKLRFRLQLDQLQHFLECHALPVIVKAAPARDAMKVAVRLDLGQTVEFVPGQPDRLLHQTANAEIPPRRIKARHRAVMQHRPLQGQRLPGR